MTTPTTRSRASAWPSTSGESQIDLYARSLFRALKPGGVVLNHAISLMRPEEDPLADKFTMRYVFPDGEPLLLSRVQLAFERARFYTEHVEGFMTDYAVTLRHWHDRLDEHLVEAERLAGARAAARLAAVSARRAPRIRRRLHRGLPAEGTQGRGPSGGLNELCGCAPTETAPAPGSLSRPVASRPRATTARRAPARSRRRPSSPRTTSRTTWPSTIASSALAEVPAGMSAGAMPRCWSPRMRRAAALRSRMM